MGSVCQCATGHHDVLHWTSQLLAPALNGPELRRTGDGRNRPGYTQTCTHLESRKKKEDRCALMKSVVVYTSTVYVFDT